MVRIRSLWTVPFEVILGPKQQQIMVINTIRQSSHARQSSNAPHAFFEIPAGIDYSIAGAFLMWASERFPEVKVNDVLPHIVMIRSVGAIHCSNIVQVIRS